MGIADGEEWEPLRRPRHARRRARAPSSRGVPFAQRPAPRSRRRAMPVPPTLAGAARRDACRPRRASAASSTSSAGGDATLAAAHRHHLARRHGLDQSRRLGEPARHLRPRATERRVPRARRSSRRSAGRMAPQRPAHRARHRREQPVPACWRRSGCRRPLFGARLLPIGTLYDPFIQRGLDALNYACYQDARFMLVATPSGLTLAPEGGAHQSIVHAADRHRPARPDRLRAGLCRRARGDHALGLRPHAGARTAARSICACRRGRSTSRERALDRALAAAIVAGAYWLRAARAGRRAGDRLCGAGGAGGAGRARSDRWRTCPGPACWRSPRPTGCTPTGRRRGGGASRAHRIERLLARAGARRGAGHRARRPPGDAVLAGRGARPARPSAGRRPLRPVGRHPRPLPRPRHRRRRDRRRRRPRLHRRMAAMTMHTTKLAERLAALASIDLGRLGKTGEVTARDVAALLPLPQNVVSFAAPPRALPTTRNERLVHAKREMPHFYQTIDVAWTGCWTSPAPWANTSPRCSTSWCWRPRACCAARRRSTPSGRTTACCSTTASTSP